MYEIYERRPGKRPLRPGMTPDRLRILRTIDELTRQHGFPPSFEEIGDAVGLSSLATVSKHTTNLKRAGMLTSEPMIARTLTLTAKGRKQLVPDGDLALLREALWYIELAAADHDSIGDSEAADRAGELASRIRKRVGPVCPENRKACNLSVPEQDFRALMSATVQSRKTPRARPSAAQIQPIALNSKLTQSVDIQQKDIDAPFPRAYKGE